LAGLAAHGDSFDLKFGRKYLSHDSYDVRLEATEIVERFGDQSDSQTLVQIAKSTEGILQEAAARAAMRLDPGPGNSASALLRTADKILISIVLQSFMSEDDTNEKNDFLEPFLTDEKEELRLSALAYLVKRYSEGDLENLLGRYTSQKPYYYDVVCWLDRILYAPSRLKEMYQRKLGEQIFEA